MKTRFELAARGILLELLEGRSAVPCLRKVSHDVHHVMLFSKFLRLLMLLVHRQLLARVLHFGARAKRVVNVHQRHNFDNCHD